MKHYLKAVRRRLRLPKKLRDRVMSDFASSIEARREAGATDEEILAELGTPREAAANLNEQMQAFTYRKSPWRWACLVPMALGLLLLLTDCLFVLFLALQSCSVGFIGGADGPSAIFVTSTPGAGWIYLVWGLVFLGLSIFGFWKLGHLQKK